MVKKYISTLEILRPNLRNVGTEDCCFAVIHAVIPALVTPGVEHTLLHTLSLG